MADVLSVDHVDDVLAYVLGMVANALEGPDNPHDVQRPPDCARILHHEGDALALDGFVLFVNEPVLPGYAERRFHVHAGERIERVVNHLGDHATEVLDLAVLVSRTLHRRQAGGDIPDLFALIADALEVGDGLDDGDYHAQIAGGR